ncbi:hypothetical protein [Afipia felis]|uniref:Uncharacterized protein n=2 Tax=Afipia felis TaxID=1035 RepID=A0A380WCH0_AFIFE|nr:hypothetical protein [Afipia felis]EKS29300.1 hypothetical protein HMPREF9697_01828 [Afipia felis ATCC 53690]SUU78008.1 Uncharacterised protein [Afipia felis]SUU86073.1 Uncharacterised protein [Afipia felis]
MSPEEKALYQMHMFDIGDVVAIADTDSVGEITGFLVADGQEDSYRVLYTDAAGSPHETWWRASLLSSVGSDDNVICFNCAKAARSSNRNNATVH